MTSDGAGWVQFRPKYPSVIRVIRKFCQDNVRNELTDLHNGSFIWNRMPDERGAGVAKGCEQGDFRRVVAAAMLVPGVSTLQYEGWRGKDVLPNFVAEWVTIEDHGWKSTKEELTETITRIIIEINVKIESVTA